MLEGVEFVTKLPEGWTDTTIGNFVDFKGGSQPPQSTFIFEETSGYMRLIQIRDYRTDNYKTYIPENLARTTCDVDDVMIGRYGPPVFQILRGLRGAYNVALIKAAPKEGLSKSFLLHILSQDKLFSLIDALSRRSSGQSGVDMGALRSFALWLPPVEEQKAIVSFIENWDNAIRDTTQLIAAKARLKRALMQQLLTGKMRFREFEGQAWRTVTLGSVLEEVSRYVVWDDNATYNLVSIRRRSGGLFSRAAVRGEDILSKVMKTTHAGDFVIARMQAVHGAFAMTSSDFHGYNVSDSYTTFVARQDSNLYMPFLHHLSHLSSFYGLALRSAYGVSIEKMTFNVPWFLRESITLPKSIEEQRKIADVLDLATREIELLEDQLAALKQQKRGLMQKLLTGEVRVKASE